MMHTYTYDADLEIYKVDPPLEFCGLTYGTVTLAAFVQLVNDGIVSFPTFVATNFPDQKLGE